VVNNLDFRLRGNDRVGIGVHPRLSAVSLSVGPRWLPERRRVLLLGVRVLWWQRGATAVVGRGIQDGQPIEIGEALRSRHRGTRQIRVRADREPAAGKWERKTVTCEPATDGGSCDADFPWRKHAALSRPPAAGPGSALDRFSRPWPAP